MSQDQALKFCQNILKKVSRSFALTIPRLDDNLYHPVMVTYLQDRLLDNFEDEIQDISLKKRKYLMDRVVEIFEPENSSPTEAIAEIEEQASLFKDQALARLTQNAHLLREAYNSLENEVQQISYKWLVKMNDGMQKYLSKNVETFSDLDEYCYYVAGTVGGFLTETIIYKEDINEKKEQILRDKFKNSGRFLQKVNIIRDIQKDVTRREKNYWPLKSLGLTLPELMDSQNQKQSVECLDRMIADVCNHVPDLLDYYRALPDSLPGYKRFYALNNALGLATLEKMQGNPDVFFKKRKVKVNKLRFLQILKAPEKIFLQKSEKYV
ncbi:MAG: squalene/phytoene synthase family protein [Halanaerobiaceae bacterium]